MIHDIKRALEGYHGDIKDRIHYSEWIRRMAPIWLSNYVKEHEYVVEQLKRIEQAVVPGYANHIASETLRQIREGKHETMDATS